MQIIAESPLFISGNDILNVFKTFGYYKKMFVPA